MIQKKLQMLSMIFFINTCIAENIKKPTETSRHERLRDYCTEKIPDDVVFDMPLLTADT